MPAKVRRTPGPVFRVSLVLGAFRLLIVEEGESKFKYDPAKQFSTTFEYTVETF